MEHYSQCTALGRLTVNCYQLLVISYQLSVSYQKIAVQLTNRSKAIDGAIEQLEIETEISNTKA